MVSKQELIECEIVRLAQAIADYELPPRRWFSKHGALTLSSVELNSTKLKQLRRDYIELAEEKESQICKVVNSRGMTEDQRFWEA